MTIDLKGAFKPDALTVRQLFTNADSYYQIPDYQRPYSWEDEQIEQLWDDVYAAMNAGSDSYFLGPVILTGPQDGRFEIVDGQQRLTTLTILFCVLRDCYLKNDSRLQNAIRSLEEGKYRLYFRLANQPHVQNTFEQQILNGIAFPERPLTKRERERQKLLNAALIFRDKLGELNGESNRMQQFLDYLLNRVVLITITCRDRSYAVRLFQVLNARGLDLSPADLIKSELYSKLDANRISQFMANWREIESMAEDMDESLTMLFTYYQYFLLARNPERSLYEELLNQFRDLDANDVVYRFRQFVACFKELYGSQSKLLYAFWYLPNQVFWKAILTTAKLEGFNDVDGLCRQLRRVFYSYWIAGYTTTKIKQLAFNLVGLVKRKASLDDIQREIDEKMADDSVVRRMRESLNNEVYGEPWLKPLLVLIEYAQTDDSKADYIELDQRLHVDHILPERWSAQPEWRSRWTTEQAVAWVGRLGNLTLLSGTKNEAANNFTFEKKRHIYLTREGKTAFEISKLVAEQSEWTDRQVRERHDWLLSQVERLLGVALANGDAEPESLETDEEVSVGPSEEVLAVGDTKKELAERHILRRRFWESLLALAKTRTQLHANISPGIEHWVGTGAGKSGLAFNYVVFKHESQIDLYIDRGKGAESENKTIFDQLFKAKAAIESVFGGPLDWERLEGKRACRIKRRLSLGGIRDEEKWPEVQQAMVDMMIRFEKAFRPYIDKLYV